MEDTRTATSAQARPASLARLADIMSGADREAAKAARESLAREAHRSARPGGGQARQKAALELLGIARSGRPRAVRAEALYLLGFVGGPESVTGLSSLLADKELGEDARMALERIPGAEAEKALREALTSHPTRAAAIRQSLAARRLTMGRVGTPSR